MSAIPLVIWLPEPIATASRACFSAGTSLTPSPIIAVKRPRSASAPTSAFFCSGVMRQKIVLLSAAGGEPAVVGGQSGPSITPASRGHADGVRDRGHGLAGVARDQLQVHALLAHELDRLGGVGAQLLLEHDQRARLEPRRRLAARIVGSAAARLAEGDHAPPGGGVLARASAGATARARAPRRAASTSGAPST